MTHREVFRNLILRHKIPGDQMTYLEPRLLTIKDVAVNDTRSGRSDRTTNIRCSSLHAFSHSPVEEIDRQRTWKGWDPKSTANSTTFVYVSELKNIANHWKVAIVILLILIGCKLKGSFSVLKRRFGPGCMSTITSFTIEQFARC